MEQWDILRYRITHFYSRPCGRGDTSPGRRWDCAENFYSRPCGRGDDFQLIFYADDVHISTHAPAGGATTSHQNRSIPYQISTHAPAGGATIKRAASDLWDTISTHAPAGGATSTRRISSPSCSFLLTPLREGRQKNQHLIGRGAGHFYSRPCGRGDRANCKRRSPPSYFYSRPCGRGDSNFPQVRHEVLRQIAER